MNSIKSITLLTIAQAVLWVTFLACHLIDQSIFRSGEVFSKYGAVESTRWVFIPGILIVIFLLCILAARINREYKTLKLSLYVTAVSSILTLLFRLDTRNFSFHVHRWATVFLFLALVVGLITTSIQIRTRLNTVLSASAMVGFIVLVLSSGVFYRD